MTFQIEKMSVPDLLQTYALVLEELRARGIVRTSNNPIGDYAEWLVAKQLGLELSANSTASYDATDNKGIRYQIKSRRVTSRNPSTQLGAIRNLVKHGFDFLIAIIFNERFEVQIVVSIPYETVQQYAKFKDHVNGHILMLRGGILLDPNTKNLTNLFKKDLPALIVESRADNIISSETVVPDMPE